MSQAAVFVSKLNRQCQERVHENASLILPVGIRPQVTQPLVIGRFCQLSASARAKLNRTHTSSPPISCSRSANARRPFSNASGFPIKLALPRRDRQTWIAQILHENCEDVNEDDNVDMSSNVLVDGRALCQVANAIQSGSVEVIHQDKSSNVRLYLEGFLSAALKYCSPGYFESDVGRNWLMSTSGSFTMDIAA